MNRGEGNSRFSTTVFPLIQKPPATGNSENDVPSSFGSTPYVSLITPLAAVSANFVTGDGIRLRYGSL